MIIEKRWDVYMTSEGKVVGWRDLEEIRDGGTVEIGLRMRGGGKKKKGTRIGNQRGNLVSGGESTGSEETENSTEDEAKKDAMLHEMMSKAKVEGGPMHEMVETLAVLGQREREEMMRCMRTGYLGTSARRNVPWKRLECWGSDGWWKRRSKKIREC